MEERYFIYENWRAENKAVVHKDCCPHSREANVKMTNNWLINNHSPNGRWFGYFFSLKDAVDFAILLPRRKFKLCEICLKNLIDKTT